jgi:hypothetical protein
MVECWGKPANEIMAVSPRFPIDQRKEKSISTEMNVPYAPRTPPIEQTEKSIIPASWCREKYQKQSNGYQEACGSERP